MGDDGSRRYCEVGIEERANKLASVKFRVSGRGEAKSDERLLLGFGLEVGFGVQREGAQE
jgi:hypothetical protein